MVIGARRGSHLCDVGNVHDPQRECSRSHKISLNCWVFVKEDIPYSLKISRVEIFEVEQILL